MDDYTIENVSGWKKLTKKSYKLKLNKQLNLKTITEFIEKYTKPYSVLQIYGKSDKTFMHSVIRVDGIYYANHKPVDLYKFVKEMMNYAPQVEISHLVLEC